MRRTILWFLVSVFSFSASSLVGAPYLFEFGSEEGVTRLERSKHKIDFFKLANFFQTQPNGVECGPTTGSIILNALRFREGVERPVDRSSVSATELGFLNPEGTPPDKIKNPFLQKYTPLTFFNDQVNVIKTRDQMFGKTETDRNTQGIGIGLVQLGKMLEAHGLKVKVQIVDGSVTREKMHEEIVANLKTKNDYVIVNYFRLQLTQKGGGHISPVGAYDEQTRSFLIMDVNPNKAPWVWVDGSDLLSAMDAVDSDTQQPRGYILVSEK